MCLKTANLIMDIATAHIDMPICTTDESFIDQKYYALPDESQV